MVILYVTSWGIISEGLFKWNHPLKNKKGTNFFCKNIETSRDGNERFFHVSFRSFSKNFVSLEFYLEIFDEDEPFVSNLSEARNSSVNKLEKLHLNTYLASVFHLGFYSNDGLFVFVDESIHYEVVCTEANLCKKSLAQRRRTTNVLLWLACTSLRLETFSNAEGA